MDHAKHKAKLKKKIMDHKMPCGCKRGEPCKCKKGGGKCSC